MFNMVMAIGKRMRRRGKAVEEEEGSHDDGTRRDWAGGLPEGILDMISDRLSVRDCVSFIDVCRSWSNVIQTQEQSKLPIHRGFPLLLGSGQRFRCRRNCLSVLDNFSSIWEIDMTEAYMKYCWGSFHDWLILVKQLPSPISSFIGIKLYNPFSRVTVDLPMKINCYRRMVLSGRPSEKDFVCILLPKQHGVVDFWVPGLEKWHTFCRLSCITLEDGVFCNGSFYLLTGDYNVVKIDLRDVFPVVVCRDCDSPIRTQFLEMKMSKRPRTEDCVLRYLVESQGEVLLVCRFLNPKSGATIETMGFRVYKLDVYQMAWEEVENLGARVLFLGRCCSRSFSAVDLGVQNANCIYFTNDHRVVCCNEWDFPKFQQRLSRFAFEGLEENTDWGTFCFNDKDLGNFHGNHENCAPIWISAPLSSCCRGVGGEKEYKCKLV